MGGATPPTTISTKCAIKGTRKGETQMKRKLKRFWKEWGVSLEEVKAFITVLLIFGDLYLMYILAWSIS